MKLSINKSYIVFTTSNYIENKQIRVLGYINYDRASQYQSMIENIAINEKFIEATGNTEEYLKSQIYYDCVVIENINGEWTLTDEHIVLWDDIIDSKRTQKLNEEYVYRLAFKFKNFDTSDTITKEKVIATIENAINTVYNSSKDKIELEMIEVTDNSLNATETQLEETQKMLEKANTTLAALVSLEDAANNINAEFSDNDILKKVNTISTNLDTISNSISNIENRLQ